MGRVCEAHVLVRRIPPAAAPHHITDIVSITYREMAGCIDGVERQAVHPVWWKHWRNLEIAKKNVQVRSRLVS